VKDNEQEKFKLEEMLGLSRRRFEEEVAPLYSEQQRLVRAALAGSVMNPSLAQRIHRSSTHLFAGFLSEARELLTNRLIAPIAVAAVALVIVVSEDHRVDQSKTVLSSESVTERLAMNEIEKSAVTVRAVSRKVAPVQVVAPTELAEVEPLLSEESGDFVLTLLEDEGYETEDLEVAWSTDDMMIDLGEVQIAMQLVNGDV
jgi:hypothetical protein